ncbi:uncharacterized protein LOC117110921 [Anneissia japonica]|uniref:uncharacterized protein LOC117110921 n=1 Tax=Anneissia japonica TaxID=1529436 RepID=UPI001425884B|nr:uncharacterized protein LOC117110921 [Anneissia japonica]
MFYCFTVAERHRNFLRFFWFRNNDYDEPLIEYRMRKHVFGNSPSPAVANFGLRDVVKHAEEDVKEFVNYSFYVDDGLISCNDLESAISLMKRTKTALIQKANINLHKIASNSQMVLDAFPMEDKIKEVRDLNVNKDNVLLHRTLGVQWRLSDDMLTFDVNIEDKPYTKRGVLATINGVFDPLGFVAPIMIQARVLFRNMITATSGWDEELPVGYQRSWKSWKDGLNKLTMLSVPRAYPLNIDKPVRLYVLCDDSELAVAAVAYLMNKDDTTGQASFVFGKSKLALKAGHTIPRLELCAAVLATKITQVVCMEIDIPSSEVIYHSDSKVVLGYLNNTTRRFHTYVANRV